MSSVYKIKQKAKNFYFNIWRGHEKICPAFNEIVYLTKLGWNHIAHHPRHTLVDVIIRLKKLPLARQVLESATTYQTVQKRHDIYYYGLQSIVDDTRVKIVVTSKGKRGKKLLYSVMFMSISRKKQRTIDIQNAKIIAKFRKQHYKGVARRRI
jgi:hypothetical protein